MSADLNGRNTASLTIPGPTAPERYLKYGVNRRRLGKKNKALFHGDTRTGKRNCGFFVRQVGGVFTLCVRAVTCMIVVPVRCGRFLNVTDRSQCVKQLLCGHRATKLHNCVSREVKPGQCATAGHQPCPHDSRDVTPAAAFPLYKLKYRPAFT